jgi:hypothetical protein
MVAISSSAAGLTPCAHRALHSPVSRYSAAHERRAAPLVLKQSVHTIYPPDNHHREACRLVGSLKGNAALIAAFSFAAATRSDLPPDANAILAHTYVLSTTLTLALNLVAVFVGQQLLYRMADGTFGSRLDDGTLDPERTILGIILSNYAQEFNIVRVCFLSGVATMLVAIGSRAWIVYEPVLAGGVTAIFAAAGGAMAYSAVGTAYELERVRLFEAASSREVFVEIDVNGDGRLSSSEITTAMRRCGYDVSKPEVDALVRRTLAGSESGADESESMLNGEDDEPTLDQAGFTKLLREYEEAWGADEAR